MKKKKLYNSAKFDIFSIEDYHLRYADINVRKKWIKSNVNNIFFNKIKDMLSTLEDKSLKKKYHINEDTGGNNTWELMRNEKGVKFYRHNGTKNMILSQDIVLDMNTVKTRKNNNILVFGGYDEICNHITKPNILQANASFIVQDVDGKILKSTGIILEEKGYDIHILNLSNPELSHCYNPFHYIHNEIEILKMVNTIMVNTEGKIKNDVFLEKSENCLLCAICFYISKEYSYEKQNFDSVLEILNNTKNNNENTNLHYLMSKLKNKDQKHLAYKMYSAFKNICSEKNQKLVIDSCISRLNIFQLENIKKMTNKNTIDVEYVGEKPMAVFCITDSKNARDNFLTPLFYTQIIETMFYNSDNKYCEMYGKIKSPIPVRFMFSDFARIGKIIKFDEYMAIMRLYNISFTICMDSINVLKKNYEKEQYPIIGNCDSIAYLSDKDNDTEEFMQKIIEPLELKKLNNSSCIITINGIKPFYCKKYDYVKHPNFNKTGDYDNKLIYNIQKRLE